MTATLRLFVAVDVPRPVVPDLPPGPGASDHITLRFLGDVPEERVGPLGHALERALSGATSVRATFQGLGAFPSPARPRVVWVGVTDGRAGLEDLARRVEGAMAAIGLPPADHPFTPHVSVRRIRPGSDVARLRTLLESHAHTVFGTTTLDAVLLKSSLLGREGAQHSTLLRVPLAPAPS